MKPSNMLYCRVYIPSVRRYGEVVGYTEDYVQVVLDDTPPDEPRWFGEYDVGIIIHPTT